MKRVWAFVYSYCLLPLIWLVIRTLALVKRKVRRGIRGRRNLFAFLETHIANKLGDGMRIWFHASSLGEFEQAKPIIAALKQRHPEVRVIVTFFSPSGYEHSRKYPLADVISYLPFDTRRNARRFLELTRPDVAVIIRYDVWPNHIWELQRRHIPILIANATMRTSTKRRFLRGFHHYIYDAITGILTVSQRDVDAFGIFKLRHPHIEAIGDTRFDQVSIRSAEAKKRHIMAASILDGKKILVAGSTWPEDDEVLLPALAQLFQTMTDLLVILVPHEPTEEHLDELESMLEGVTTHIRFSELNAYHQERVIVVDSIGILLTLYTYAQVAYVGGSFKQNVHNVLEAAVYGIPVVYGPKHRNSQEAIQLAAAGGGFVVEDARTLYRTLRLLLLEKETRTKAGDASSRFVRENTGATEKFLRHIEPYLEDHTRRTGNISVS